MSKSATDLLNTFYATLRQRLPWRLFVYARSVWRLVNPSVARSTLKKRRIIRTITAEKGFVVQRGPFAGMRLVPGFGGGGLSSRALLGSYEAELHGAIERLMQNDYDRVVNVGCGRGYYAVGLALRLPGARVYASDTSPYDRELCRKTARANGVGDRVTVIGKTDLRVLQGLLDGRTLIVMDCEGCERDLLRPDLVPQLTTCDVVVELHDSASSPMSEVVVQRFAETHDVELLNSVERDPSRFPVLRSLSADEQKMAVAEYRPDAMGGHGIRALSDRFLPYEVWRRYRGRSVFAYRAIDRLIQPVATPDALCVNSYLTVNSLSGRSQYQEPFFL